MVWGSAWRLVKQKWTAILEAKWFPWACVLIGMLLVSPILGNGYFYDDWMHKELVLEAHGELEGFYTAVGLNTPEDPLTFWDVNYYFFRFIDGNPDYIQHIKERGSWPWWAQSDLKVAFWRPLTALTHWLDYTYWPDSPFVMHLQSVFWYGMAILCVFMLFQGIIDKKWIAGLALLLFALDETHTSVVGWISNRSALLIVITGSLSILAHHYWRAFDWKPGKLLAPSLFLVSLLFGEGGTATGAYIMAYAICMDKGSWMQRFITLLPYGVLFILWRAVYRFLDFGVNHGFYIDPLNEPIRFFYGLIERLPILFYFVWGWSISSYLSLSPMAFNFLWWVSILLMIAVGLFLIPLLKTDPRVRFFALGTLLATIPVTAMAIYSPRLVFFASVGSVALMAIWLANLWNDKNLYSRRWIKRLAWCFAAFLIFVQFFQSPYMKFAVLSHSYKDLSNMRLALTDIGMGPEIRNQEVFVLNPPYIFAFVYLHAQRNLQDQPIPQALRVLSPGYFPVEIERISPQSLAVRPKGGFFPHLEDLPTINGNLNPIIDLMYLYNRLDEGRAYSSRNAFEVGDQVKLSGMRVEITELTKNAGPAEAVFTFDKPLESPDNRWLEYVPQASSPIGVYKPWEIPEVGQTVVVGEISEQE